MAPAKSFNLEKLFLALADRTRLRLLNLLRQEEVCVCFFVEVLGESQPKISRHLAYLRRAGIVAARRQGKWMHYKIIVPSDEHAAQVLDQTLAWAAEDPEMTADRARLVTVCCAPAMPVRLQMAPRPAVPVGEANQSGSPSAG